MHQLRRRKRGTNPDQAISLNDEPKSSTKWIHIEQDQDQTDPNRVIPITIEPRQTQIEYDDDIDEYVGLLLLELNVLLWVARSCALGKI